MATPSQHPRLTAADLLALEDDGYRHELEAGFLLSEPLPTPRHDRVRRRLEQILDAFVTRHRLGEVFGEAGFVLARDPDTVRGPDLSFVSAERLVGLDDTRFFEGAPDLAVEILSPSNRPYQVRAKVADYLAAGSRIVWVIDPGKRSVTTWSSILAPQSVPPDGELSGEDVLPGFRASVASLFEGC